MQDAHHRFVPPFLPNFVFGIPFGMDLVTDSQGKRKFKFIECPLTEAYLKNNQNVENVSNLYITEINFNGDTTNLRPPIDVLSEIGKDTYLEGWNPHAHLAKLFQCLFNVYFFIMVY
jgi:hypothetical protein